MNIAEELKELAVLTERHGNLIAERERALISAVPAKVLEEINKEFQAPIESISAEIVALEAAIKAEMRRQLDETLNWSHEAGEEDA